MPGLHQGFIQECNKDFIMDVTVSIVMGIALLFYTIGVWTEKIQGKLTIWHLALFAIGLICDSLGTGIMFRLTDGISYSFHGITGLIAILNDFIQYLLDQFSVGAMCH